MIPYVKTGPDYTQIALAVKQFVTWLVRHLLQIFSIFHAFLHLS